MKATRIEGRDCDYSEIEDSGAALYRVEEGPHTGHTLQVSGQKFNGGDSTEDRACSCGATASQTWPCWADTPYSGAAELGEIQLQR